MTRHSLAEFTVAIILALSIGMVMGSSLVRIFDQQKSCLAPISAQEITFAPEKICRIPSKS